MIVISMEAPLSEPAQCVADHLHTLGYEKNIVMLSATGKISAETAAGLGCSVTEITKSIIFRRAEDDMPVLVIASGTNRVGEARVSAHVGVLAKADVEFVRERIGYIIGDVCPVSHAAKPVMLPDQDLLQYDSLWTTTGHPHAVFSLTPTELETMVGTPAADIIQYDRPNTWTPTPARN